MITIITSTEITDCGDVKVGAVSSHGEQENFYVQLTDNAYMPSLGSWITTDDCGEDIDQDDYPDFDFDVIIEAAEDFAKEDFESNFTEKEVNFNVRINSKAVVMHICNETGKTELLVKNVGNFSDHEREYPERGIIFTSEAGALKFADSFRTDAHEDAQGLSALINAM